MVIFTYKKLQLILPSPQLGDRNVLVLRTKIDHSMNGTIHAFRTSPFKQRFHLDFIRVNRPKIIEVINFLKATSAQFINYTDYRNVTWRGKILTQPFTETHASVRNNTFSLEFELA